MTPVVHRNILLLGRTLTGKSTLKSVLVDPTTMAKGIYPWLEGGDPHIESFNVHSEQIVLNIIDTPGMFERCSDADLKRSNEAILQTMKVFIQRAVTELHVICFCIAVIDGLNSDDIKSIRLLYEYFGENIKRISCLIVTRCENEI
jgi:predicted GTPase